MEILWTHGESNVREVVDRLDRPLAYTTVMTTLDRLFRRAYSSGATEDRAFFYSPSLNRAEWESKRAGDFVAELPFGHRAFPRAIDFLPGGSGRPTRRSAVGRVGGEDQAAAEELCRRARP